MNSKSNLYITVLVAFSMVLILTSTNAYPQSSAREGKLVVGIGSHNKKCGASVISSFSEDVDFLGGTTSSIMDQTSIQNEIKNKLAINGGLNPSQVRFTTSNRMVALVISYEKEIQGWNCKVKKFAVGFGDDYQSALKHAVSNKDMYLKNAPYEEVEVIFKEPQKLSGAISFKITPETKEGLEKLEQILNNGKILRGILTIVAFNALFSEPDLHHIYDITTEDWEAFGKNLYNIGKIDRDAARSLCDSYREVHTQIGKSNRSNELFWAEMRKKFE